MSTIEITSKIEALKELEALIEEAKAEAEALRDEIKTETGNRIDCRSTLSCNIRSEIPFHLRVT